MAHKYILSEDNREFYPELMEKALTFSEWKAEIWENLKNQMDDCSVYYRDFLDFFADNVKQGLFIQVQ